MKSTSHGQKSKSAEMSTHRWKESWSRACSSGEVMFFPFCAVNTKKQGERWLWPKLWIGKAGKHGGGPGLLSAYEYLPVCRVVGRENRIEWWLKCPRGMQVMGGRGKSHILMAPSLTWISCGTESAPLPALPLAYLPKLLLTFPDYKNRCSFSFSSQRRLYRTRRYRAFIMLDYVVFYSLSDLASHLYIFTFTCH